MASIMRSIKHTLNPLALKQDLQNALGAVKGQMNPAYNTPGQRTAIVAFAVLKTLALLGIGAVITFAVLNMTPFLIGAAIGVGAALVLAAVTSYGIEYFSNKFAESYRLVDQDLI